MFYLGCCVQEPLQNIAFFGNIPPTVYGNPELNQNVACHRRGAQGHSIDLQKGKTLRVDQKKLLRHGLALARMVDYLVNHPDEWGAEHPREKSILLKAADFLFPFAPRCWEQQTFAELLDVSRETVRRWAKAGLLPPNGASKRYPVRFGRANIATLRRYDWIQRRKLTPEGQKKLRLLRRQKPHLFRFPAWVKATGRKKHPLLRAWERTYLAWILGWRFREQAILANMTPEDSVRSIYGDDGVGSQDLWTKLINLYTSWSADERQLFEWVLSWKSAGVKVGSKRFLLSLQGRYYPEHSLDNLKKKLQKINRFFELESLPERKSDSVLDVLKPIP